MIKHIDLCSSYQLLKANGWFSSNFKRFKPIMIFQEKVNIFMSTTHKHISVLFFCIRQKWWFYCQNSLQHFIELENHFVLNSIKWFKKEKVIDSRSCLYMILLKLSLISTQLREILFALISQFVPFLLKISLDGKNLIFIIYRSELSLFLQEEVFQICYIFILNTLPSYILFIGQFRS
jgi:hypothetical protein